MAREICDPIDGIGLEVYTTLELHPKMAVLSPDQRELIRKILRQAQTKVSGIINSIQLDVSGNHQVAEADDRVVDDRHLGTNPDELPEPLVPTAGQPMPGPVPRAREGTRGKSAAPRVRSSRKRSSRTAGTTRKPRR
jgi:hypothetical protein